VGRGLPPAGTRPAVGRGLPPADTRLAATRRLGRQAEIRPPCQEGTGTKGKWVNGFLDMWGRVSAPYHPHQSKRLVVDSFPGALLRVGRSSYRTSSDRVRRHIRCKTSSESRARKPRGEVPH
jgi:hypothetical protein